MAYNLENVNLGFFEKNMHMILVKEDNRNDINHK